MLTNGEMQNRVFIGIVSGSLDSGIRPRGWVKTPRGYLGHYRDFSRERYGITWDKRREPRGGPERGGRRKSWNNLGPTHENPVIQGTGGSNIKRRRDP